MDPASDSPVRILHVGGDDEFVRGAVADLPPERRPLAVTAVADGDVGLDRLDGSDFDYLVVETREGTGWRSLLATVSGRYPQLTSLAILPDQSFVDDALSAGASDVLVRREAGTDDRLLRRRLASHAPERGESGTEDDRDQDENWTRERSLSELTFTDFMLDALDDVFYLIDLEGEMQRWNRTMCEVTGYTDEEIAEMDAYDLVAEDDHDTVADGMARTLETGSVTIEARLETKGGEQIPFEITGARLSDEAGESRGIAGICRDVSERWELESELERKASLLDHIFEQIPTALYVKDEDARHIRMSEHVPSPEENVGLTDPEIYGETEFARGTYRDDLRVIEECERIINKEEYNPNNGEWTLTSKVPWRDENGDVRGLIGVSRLITEKKEIERDLRLRNRAMEEAPIGIAILEARELPTTIAYANDGLEAMTGYNRADLHGEESRLLVGPETDPENIEALRAALKAGESTTAVMLVYRADGSPFWGRVTLAPVTDDAGDLTHFIGFIQDVTETKERAEEIERRLDEFADVLAEELRAPLEAAESALEAATSNGAADEVATAKRSIEQADKLVEDLTTVHSFSVKSRSVFESTDSETGDD